MQQRHVYYSEDIISPIVPEGFLPQKAQTVVHLGNASVEFVRWIRALLAQGLGWLPKDSQSWPL